MSDRIAAPLRVREMPWIRRLNSSLFRRPTPVPRRRPSLGGFAWELEPRLAPAGLTYTSNTPVVIPDPGTISTGIIVPDAVPIESVQVALDISHTYVSDLDISLITPQGTRIQLLSDVGGSGQNLIGTTLDDAASSTLQDGSAPFTGIFRPEQALSSLVGESTAGDWILEITDTFGVYDGTLQAWSITFNAPRLPNLQGTALSFSNSDPIGWGSSIPLRYVITNGGRGASSATTANFVLSQDAVIDASDLVLAVEPITTLDPQAGQSRIITVTLPGNPPPGWPESGRVYLGLIVDPDNAVEEETETDNANRGNSIDRLPLTIYAGQATLSGQVWNDRNRNSVLEPGESYLSAIEVFLDRNRNGIVDPGEPVTTTDSSGRYTFTVPTPDSYSVRIVPRSGLRITAPLSSTPETIFAPSLTQDDGGMTHSGTNDQWQRITRLGRPSFTFGSQGNDGSFSYAPNSDGTLWTPTLDLTGYDEQITLTFEHLLGVEPFYDSADVLVRTADGQIHIVATSNPTGVNSNAVPLFASTVGYSGITIDLSNYRGQSITIGFRFRSDDIVEQDGWSISQLLVKGQRTGINYVVDVTSNDVRNDLNFGGLLSPDVTVSFVVYPSGLLYWGQNSSATVTIRNQGLLTSSEATLELFLSATNQITPLSIPLGRETISSLVAGQSLNRVVSFTLPRVDDLPFPVGLETLSFSFIARVTLSPADSDFDLTNNETRTLNQVAIGKPAQITGTVWNDLNANGVRDPNEPGVAGVRVRLDGNRDGGLDDTAISGIDGTYRFDDVMTTQFRVILDPGESFRGTQTFPVPLVESAILRATFDQNDHGFHSTGPVDQWHRTVARGTAAYYFGSGESPLSGGRYASNADGALYSPTIDLRSLSGRPVLRFRHFLDAETYYDFASVAVIDQYGVEHLLATSNTSIVQPGLIYLPSQTAGFQDVELSLGNYTGQLVQIVFRFTSDAIVQREGWYLSTVSVVVPAGQTYYDGSIGIGETQSGFDFGFIPRADLVARSLSLSQTNLGPADTVDLRYSIENQGSLPSGAFTIQVRLSTDPAITSTDDLLAEIRILDGISAGEFLTGNVAITIPSRFANGNLLTSGSYFIGLVIDSANEVIEASEGNNITPPDGTGLPAISFKYDPIVLESANNDTLSTAQPVNHPFILDGSISSTRDIDIVRFEVPTTGRLVATMTGRLGMTPDLRLSLLTDLGDLILTSDDAALGNPLPLIDQHVRPGTYYLRVEAAGGSQAGVGAYRLRTTFEDSPSPLDPQPVGAFPLTERLVDLDGDGNIDAVGPSPGSDGVTIQYGSGQGGFDQLQTLFVGDGPVDLVVADLNNDGTPDLVTANRDSGDISVLFGQGKRTFSSPTRYRIGDRLTAVTVADLDGDRWLDVITANPTSGTVSILYGTSSGSFLAPIRLLAGVGTSDVAAADVDADGRPDLVVTASGDNSIVVLRNLGGRLFGLPRAYDAGEGASEIHLARIDGDAILDAVVTNPVAGGVSILFGTASGTFEQRLFVPMTSRDGRTQSVAVADLNQDGITDLIAANNLAKTVVIRLGNGDGSFREPPTPDGYASTDDDRPVHVTTGDVNHDGKTDMVVVFENNFNLWVRPGNGDGTFGEPVRPSAGADTYDIASGDFDEDGIPDLVTANFESGDVGILRGLGDGSFAPARRVTGAGGKRVVVADMNGDGHQDLVLANYGGGRVSILLGNGDGSFRPELSQSAGDGVQWVTVGDVNGDGKLDAVVAVIGAGQVSVLLGHGDGSLQPAVYYSSILHPASIVISDVDRDGFLDLVVSDFGLGEPGVHYGRGDGTFTNSVTFDAFGDRNPWVVTIADINGDGSPDLVTANLWYGGVTVALAKATGDYETPRVFAGNDLASRVDVIDVNSDGKLDILYTTPQGTVGVLIGDGIGDFTEPRYFLVGGTPRPIVAGDWNRDGQADLATVNTDSRDVTALLGNGDGSFRTTDRTTVVENPIQAQIADLDNDGNLDVIVSSPESRAISILMGNGDGTFRTQPRVTLPATIRSFAISDINSDRRLDLIVTTASGSFRVFGNGDGTFQTVSPITSPLLESSGEGLSLGDNLGIVRVADINGDGSPDLLVSTFLADPILDMTDNTSTYGIIVLLGDGKGTFQDPNNNPSRWYLPAGNSSSFDFQVADLDRDGKLDLVTTTDLGTAGRVAWLRGRGNGTFETYAAAGATIDLSNMFAYAGFSSFEIADADGDGKLDVVAGLGNSVAIAQGRGDGTFGTLTVYPSGFSVSAAAVANLNGDARPDLVSVNLGNNNIVSFLGQGHGIYSTPRSFATGPRPTALQIADLNRDGRADLLVINNDSNDLSILLGDGTGGFNPVSSSRTVDIWNTPHLVDMDRDGVNDVVVLNSSGDVLYRRGRGGAIFDPPVVVNPTTPARDVVPVWVGTSYWLATTNQGSDTVSLYGYASNTGQFESRGLINVGSLPVRLAAADLSGEGIDEIVVGNTLDATISILSTEAGRAQSGSMTLQYGLAVTRSVGIAPSAIQLVDFNGDGRRDIAVTSRGSGDITIFSNDGSGSYLRSDRYRSGNELRVLESIVDRPRSISQLEPVAMTASDLNRDGRLDLTIRHQGTNQISTLMGTATGGLTNPHSQGIILASNDGATYRTGQMITADFNGDGRDDLAIAMEDRNEVWIYLGTSVGGYDSTPIQVSAGRRPTGLSVGYADDAGKAARAKTLDLFVGNANGDVLTLLGQGDGSFRSFIRLDQRVSLETLQAVDGSVEIIQISQALDRASTLIRQPGSQSIELQNPFLLDRNNGLIGPGDIKLVDVNGDGRKDLIVANTGGNEILVYLRDLTLNKLSTVPQRFYSGTAPVSIAVGYLNDDDSLDLAVANQGSNDISIFYGKKETGNNQDVFDFGPRLSSTGIGPIKVEITDSVATNKQTVPDGIADIRVVNSQSNTIATIPGVGRDLRPTGFLDSVENASITPLPNIGPIISIVTPSNTTAIVRPGSGSLSQIDLTTGKTRLLYQPSSTAPPLSAFRVAPVGGTIFGTTLNGDIVVVGNPALTRSTGISNLAAIDVLRVKDGFDVYVTNGVDPATYRHFSDLELLGQFDSAPAPFPPDRGPISPFPVIGPLEPLVLGLVSETDPGTTGVNPGILPDNPLDLTVAIVPDLRLDVSPLSDTRLGLVVVATIVTTFSGPTSEESELSNDLTGTVNPLDFLSFSGLPLDNEVVPQISVSIDGEEIASESEPTEKTLPKLSQFLSGASKALEQWQKGEPTEKPMREPVAPQPERPESPPSSESVEEAAADAGDDFVAEFVIPLNEPEGVPVAKLEAITTSTDGEAEPRSDWGGLLRLAAAMLFGGVLGWQQARLTDNRLRRPEPRLPQ